MDHSIRPITQPARIQPTNIQLHDYEVTTIPPHVRPEDVEMLAEAKRLPRSRIKAISADAARKTALHVLRDPIHDVVKIVERTPT